MYVLQCSSPFLQISGLFGTGSAHRLQPNVGPCVSCRPNPRPPFSRLPAVLSPFVTPYSAFALTIFHQTQIVFCNPYGGPPSVYVHCPLLAPTSQAICSDVTCEEHHNTSDARQTRRYQSTSGYTSSQRSTDVF